MAGLPPFGPSQLISLVFWTIYGVILVYTEYCYYVECVVRRIIGLGGGPGRRNAQISCIVL